MLKADKRAAKRERAKYGHTGTGASHTREGTEAETRRHVQKIQQKRSKGGTKKSSKRGR